MKNLPEKHRPLRFAPSIALAFALALGGCASVQDLLSSEDASDTSRAAKAGPGDDAHSGTRGPVRLAEGVTRYEAGDFVGAIRTLNAPEISRSDTRTRVEANKYLAFSYCVTNRRTLCRQSFDRALRLDPAFRLTPAEAGHPLWGPVYAQARKAARAE